MPAREVEEGDQPLTGPTALSLWDAALARAMNASDRAVMAERLLPALLADLG
ncbi:DUF2399 domain-containing protein [Streptomyces sp. NBC_00019]|uniref:DUF2399 domain-containing protein n=1 Tax=Streptomyces sp. NBC_00019 TaxID=2975623 RepID=UPI00324488CA